MTAVTETRFHRWYKEEKQGNYQFYAVERKTLSGEWKLSWRQDREPGDLKFDDDVVAACRTPAHPVFLPVATAAADWWVKKLHSKVRDNGDANCNMLGMWAISKIPSPTTEQCDIFRNALVSFIGHELGCGKRFITLCCDYDPDTYLRTAADEANIERSLFPWKTTMKIYGTDFIEVGDGYRSPYVTVFGEEAKHNFKFQLTERSAYSEYSRNIYQCEDCNFQIRLYTDYDTENDRYLAGRYHKCEVKVCDSSIQS
jgi:hypothetical protein